MKNFKQIRLGLVGLGFISQIAHLPELKKNKKVDLVAAAEKNPLLLNKVGKRFHINNLYKSFNHMIRKEKLDGIIVSVQRGSTYQVVKQILKRKIPVLSEKPAALNLSDAKNLVKISSNLKSLYYIAYMKIHDEGVKFVKNFIIKKKFGNLRSVYYTNFSGESYFGNDKYFKQSSNYIKRYSLNKQNLVGEKLFQKFLNSNCHSINLLRYFFPDLKLNMNELNKKGEGVLYFLNKKINIIFNNKYSKIKKNWIEEIDFYFEKGIVKLKLPPPLVKNRFSKISIQNYKKNNVQNVSLKKVRSFNNQINFFLNQIRKKKLSHHCSGKNSLADIKIIRNLF